jgi:hypothetical protein
MKIIMTRVLLAMLLALFVAIATSENADPAVAAVEVSAKALSVIVGNHTSDDLPRVYDRKLQRVKKQSSETYQQLTTRMITRMSIRMTTPTSTRTTAAKEREAKERVAKERVVA